MRRSFPLLVVAIACAAGCTGYVENVSGDQGGIKITSIGQGLQVNRFSAGTYLLARSVILEGRPKGTELFVEHLNMVLANSNISSLTLTASEVESKIKEPLGDAGAQTCPFVKQVDPQKSVACRTLAQRALDEAAKTSATLALDMQQKLRVASSTLKADELAFLKERIDESMQVGLDAGKVHTMELLRAKAVCDLTPEVKETAFNFGVSQGRTVFAQTGNKVLPTIGRNQCNTDLVASTVLAEAKTAKQDFLAKNALCAGYKPQDLPAAVDLSAQELDRSAGVDEGMKQGYESLRARLVKDWDCNACVCISGDEGKLPQVCFLRSQLEKKGILIEGKSIWEEIQAGDTHSLYALAQAGEPQCKSEKCKRLVEQYTRDECGCGGPTTLTQAQKQELEEACAPDGIPFPFQIASPLVVDLDGDGVKLLAKRIPFDLTASGKKSMIPALGGADALLALDLDGNGRIDSGAELFGDRTLCGKERCLDGLEALAQHDANRDGVIDARDPVFARLRLWRDTNADGQSSADELSTPARAGIREIQLKARLDVGFVDLAGHSATRALTFLRTDGTRGTIPDVWFNVQ
jgi:hypothetical protein